MLEYISIAIIILCLVIFYVNAYYFSCTTAHMDIKINQISGSRADYIIEGDKTGFPFIYIQLDNEIPCGIYSANSRYGEVSLYIGRNDRNKARVYFFNLDKKVDMTNRFVFTNLVRMTNHRNDFINTYNIGCCQ
jgi:hypothetical protein